MPTQDHPPPLDYTPAPIEDKVWVKVPSSLESIMANSEERVLQRLYDILIESLMANHGDLQGITVAFERFNAARQRFEWAKKLVLDNEQL